MAKQQHRFGALFSRVTLVFGVLLLAILSVVSYAPPAFADPTCKTGTPSPDGKQCLVDGKPTSEVPAEPPNNTSKDTKSATCAVEKIGWFLCPVIEQTAKMSDKAFGFLADNFLRTDPQLFSDNSGTKAAWEMSRSLANIMFILAFLAIIIAQVTGLGITNYGIKKMLPKLIVGAVAVNVSYYLCQLAVDLSNILGYEIQAALVGIANQLGPSVFGVAGQYGGAESSSSIGNGLTTIAVGALAVAGVIWLIMGPLMSVVVMVMVTVLTIIVILLLRKALIVLLIVASPIAFVLYLLPNTEKYFSKWLNMFIQLLMVFPVVGLLLGGGKLAGTIILVSGSYADPSQVTAAERCDPNNAESKKAYEKDKPANVETGCGLGAVVYSSTDDGSTTCGGGQCTVTASWQLGLIATGVTVIPLFAVYSVLQGALSAAGAIGGKIQTLSRGANGAMQRRAKNWDENRGKDINRGLKNRYGAGGGSLVGASMRRKTRKEAVRNLRDQNNTRQDQRYISTLLSDDNTGLARKVAGGNAADQERARALGASMESKAFEEDISNVIALNNGISGNAAALGENYNAAVLAGNDIQAVALARMLAQSERGRGQLAHYMEQHHSAGHTGANNSAIQAVSEDIRNNNPDIGHKDMGILGYARGNGEQSVLTDTFYDARNESAAHLASMDQRSLTRVWGSGVTEKARRASAGTTGATAKNTEALRVIGNNASRETTPPSLPPPTPPSP